MELFVDMDMTLNNLPRLIIPWKQSKPNRRLSNENFRSKLIMRYQFLNYPIHIRIIVGLVSSFGIYEKNDLLFIRIKLFYTEFNKPWLEAFQTEM